MPRTGLTLVVFLAVAAWAGAQGPAPLTAADQVRLLRANRTLLADLVDRGVELGGADHPVVRAEGCQGAARALGIALRRAAEAGDPDRVAELGEHLELMVRDGLVPVLTETLRTIPPDSPDAARLRTIRATAADDLGAARAAIPAAGKVAESARVKDISEKLEGLRDRLKE